MKSSGRVFLSEVLAGEPIVFDSTKTVDDHLARMPADEIVYEDEHTIAYVHHHEERELASGWDLKFAIALKKHVPTLLDLDVADGRSTAALLRAVQAVAYRFKLYERGFEVHIDILPPLQRKGYLEVKIRSGKHALAVQAIEPQPSL